MSKQLTLEQIKAFEDALAGPGPANDPNWEVTKQLLQLAVIQGKELINMRAQLDSYVGAYGASQEEVLRALRISAGADVAQSNVTEADVQAAAVSLEEAIKAYENGEQVARYAGSVLKFAAKLAIPLL